MKKHLGALAVLLLFTATTATAAVFPGPCQWAPRNFPKLCKKAPPPIPPCPGPIPCKAPK